MKTIKITLFLLLTLIGVNGMAQKQDRATAKKAKVDAFLTQQLALTETEQKAFLPLYNQYLSEKKQLRTSMKASKKKGKIMSELNDEEVEQIIQASFNHKQQELDLKKKYHSKFKSVISVKKVAKLYHIEKKMGSHLKSKKRKGNERRKRERPSTPSESK